MPHRQSAGDNRLDARLECPFGRLNFYGHISESEYLIGCQYRVIAHEYLESIEAPAPFPKAIDPCGGVTIGGVLEAPEDKECLRRKLRYNEALSAIKKLGRNWRSVFNALNKIIVYEESADIGLLKVGLRALAEHV